MHLLYGKKSLILEWAVVYDNISGDLSLFLEITTLSLAFEDDAEHRKKDIDFKTLQVLCWQLHQQSLRTSVVALMLPWGPRLVPATLQQWQAYIAFSLCFSLIDKEKKSP